MQTAQRGHGTAKGVPGPTGDFEPLPAARASVCEEGVGGWPRLPLGRREAISEGALRCLSCAGQERPISKQATEGCPAAGPAWTSLSTWERG